MKKKDETIQNLFDDYAEELIPRVDLTEKAKMEMAANKQAKPSHSARKKSSFWLHFAWVTPVVAVFIVMVVVLFNLPIFSLPDLSEQNTPSKPATPTVAYYTYADVKGRRVSISEYDDELQISRLETYGYEVLGAKCYAFFTEENELRYIKAYLGVRSPDGVFTELELIGEVDGYVRRDLQDIYNNYKYNDGLSVGSRYDDSGEYITQAFFATRDLHFYVVARNGESTEVAKDILKHLAGEASK